MVFLPYYLGGEHYELLQRQRDKQLWKAEPVHDLGAELADAMGPELITDVQHIKDTLSETWLDDVRTNAHRTGGWENLKLLRDGAHTGVRSRTFLDVRVPSPLISDRIWRVH